MRHIVYVLVSHMADPFKYLYVAVISLTEDKLNTEVCYVVYRIPSASVQTVTHACMPFYEYCLDQQATSLLPVSGCRWAGDACGALVQFSCYH